MKVYIVILYFLCGVVMQSELSAQQSYSLNEIIDIATEKSPVIKALQLKIDAARNRIPQNTNLPDPSLTVGLVNMPVNSFSYTQEPMTGKVIALSQGIPFPGKLDAIEKTAESDVEILDRELEEARNELKRKLEFVVYDMEYYKKVLDITNNKRDLFKTIAEVVRTKYSVAEASQQNVLSIDLAISNLNDKIIDLQSGYDIAKEKLKAYLYTEKDISLTDRFLQDSVRQRTASYKSIEETVKHNRPVLAKLMLSKLKAEKMTDVAEYEFLPDFKITVQYSQRDNIGNTQLNDFLSVLVGLNIPINYGGNKTAKIEESKAVTEFYEQQYYSLLQILRIEIESSLTKLNSIAERERLVRSAKIKLASETFNSSLAAYQVGQVDFVNVINAVNESLNIETELYNLRKEYNQESANLNFLAGTDLAE